MTDYGNPDAGDNPEAPAPGGTIPDNHRPATQAIESALIGMPNGTRTVEAKAAHIHAHLNSHGWAVLATDKGTVTVLGPDEQVMTVPDGYEATLTRIAIDGPGDQLVDPELSELAEVVARLESLAPDARERVAAYLTDRYSPDRPSPIPWPPPGVPARRVIIGEDGQA